MPLMVVNIFSILVFHRKHDADALYSRRKRRYVQYLIFYQKGRLTGKHICTYRHYLLWTTT